jgi:hypothetical protein
MTTTRSARKTGFVDVVGHEDDRARCVTPHPQKKLLHVKARLG